MLSSPNETGLPSVDFYWLLVAVFAGFLFLYFLNMEVV